MILRHRDWDAQKEMPEGVRTVEDFINKVVLTDENKNLKYYRISTKENYEGTKRNLMIYLQNNIVKSHHSTGIEFDYSKVLDWEITQGYDERTIQANDIMSMDIDFYKEKPKKQLSQEEKDKALEELKEEWEYESYVKANKNSINKDNVTIEDLVRCVKQLSQDLDKVRNENSDLYFEVERMKEFQNQLLQKIKWLDYSKK